MRQLTTISTAVLLALSSHPGTGTAEEIRPATWLLGQPTWNNSAQQNALVTLDGIEVGLDGGYARVVVRDGGACAPGGGTAGAGKEVSQVFTFRWFIDRDIRKLRHGDEVVLRFAAEGGALDPCLQTNPFIELKGWGHEWEFVGNGRFYAIPAEVLPGFHDAGDRKVRIWRPDVVQGKDAKAWFEIGIWGFRQGMDLHVIYPYAPVTGADQGSSGG